MNEHEKKIFELTEVGGAQTLSFNQIESIANYVKYFEDDRNALNEMFTDRVNKLEEEVKQLKAFDNGDSFPM